MDCDKWNLETIPSLPSTSTICSTAYFNCAYYMRNTLTKLELTQGMIGRRDFCRLGDFQQLQEIKIGDNIINEVYDCENVLVHLPKTLTKFEVDSFRMDDGKISDNIKSNSSGKNTKIRNRSRAIIHHSTLHWLSQSWIYDFATVFSWPSPTISEAVVASFLDWVFRLTKHGWIGIGGSSGEAWLLNVWHSRKGTTDERADDKRESKFKLKFLKSNYVYTSGAEFLLELRQVDDGYNPSISSEITYGCNGGRETVLSKARRCFIDLNGNVQNVEMELEKTEFEAGDYIDSLLSTTHPNLNCIITSGGKLRQHNNNAVTGGGQYVSYLEFNKTDIDEKRLGSLLTTQFPKLEVLQLSEWNINRRTDDDDDDDDNWEEEGNNTVQILMPATNLDLLRISGSDILKRPVLLIDVSSTEQNIEKYYIDVNAADKTTEISQKTFDAFKANFKDKGMVHLSIKAKSVRKVELWACVATTEGDSYRDIELEIF